MIHPTAVVFPGTIVGEGCEIQAGAIVGKPPKLARSSTAARAELPPLEIGAGSVICAQAIVFAGSRLGEGVIVGVMTGKAEARTVAHERVPQRDERVEHDGPPARGPLRRRKVEVPRIADEHDVEAGVRPRQQRQLGARKARDGADPGCELLLPSVPHAGVPFRDVDSCTTQRGDHLGVARIPPLVRSEVEDAQFRAHRGRVRNA